MKASPENVASNANVGLRVPIVMYHHVTQKKARVGKYVVLKKELENDLEYIKEQGYRTITVSELVKYVNGEIRLPEKVIMLTFDDGFESFYELAYPLFNEYEMKVVLSVVGKYTDTYSSIDDRNINYAYLTWDNIAELSKSEYVEIQSHTYDMHYHSEKSRKGLSRLNGESEEKYEKALTDDLLKMQNLLLTQSGVTATAVAYPYGSYSKLTLKIIKKLGFKASLTCEERLNNVIAGDENTLYNLGRFNRPSGVSTEEFFKRVLR